MKEIEQKEEFDQLVKTTNKLVVVEFGATWCGPCRMILPFFNRLEEELGDKVIFAKVDVDEAGDLAEECEISCMPTFILYKGGDMVKTLQGANKEQLEETIRELC
ncbi:thioredoxin-like [Haliotis rufescens]|uniref:thioredoxin-like n=1 Tax=Haliotis rufescens TaxID=6454 RepID=UPI001EB09222|nr:thioredoxin-like [Haliotis rufescens]